MKINVIPRPNFFEERQGYIKITEECGIYRDKEAVFAADYLNSLLNSAVEGFFDGITAEKADAFFVFLTDESLEDEEYSVEIDGKITVKAGGGAGFAYAVNTLRQYLELDRKTAAKEISADNIVIKDKPAYPYRGFMLDEARHFFGVKEVKRLLDLMFFLKLNKFHWHLSDDQGFRVESLKFPKLTEIATTRADTQIGGFLSNKYRGTGHAGYYKQSEILEIVVYAEKRGIEIIPEISVPGHATALIAAYPQLSCTGENVAVKNRFGTSEHVLCAGKESTYAFLQGLIEEFSGLFPSKYFHLGGNTVPLKSWPSCPDCEAKMAGNDFKDERELQTYMLNRLSAFLRERGKTAIIRNDAIFENTDAGVLGDYYIKLGDDSFAGFLGQAGKYICSRHMYYYLDHPYAKSPLKKVYNYEPSGEKAALDNCGELMGIEAVLNTEWVYDREKLDFNVFPRLIAVAERAWTDKKFKDYKSFKERLKHYNKILKKNNVNSAKLRIAESANPFVRMRELSRWALSDQYSEVRKNRQ